MASQTLTIRRPDDWHVHLRDGEMLLTVAPYTARQFARAIVMPNLAPPVTTVEAAHAYRDRILAAAGAGLHAADDLLSDRPRRSRRAGARVRRAGVWVAAKLYPAGATTNSAGGVTDIRNIYPALERMQAIGMVLCVHGEVTDPEVDVFDREAVFIERVLSRSCATFPQLKIVFEHITTAEAAEFVKATGDNIAATVTPQHLHPQPQRHLRRRPQAACLLPAGRQARGAPAGGAQGGDFGLAANSSSAPTARRMPARPRNPPAAAPASSTRLSRWKAMRRCSRRKARSTGSKASRPSNGAALLRPAAQRRHGDAGARRATCRTRSAALVPFHAGETLPWRMVA